MSITVRRCRCVSCLMIMCTPRENITRRKSFFNCFSFLKKKNNNGTNEEVEQVKGTAHRSLIDLAAPQTTRMAWFFFRSRLYNGNPAGHTFHWKLGSDDHLNKCKLDWPFRDDWGRRSARWAGSCHDRVVAGSAPDGRKSTVCPIKESRQTINYLIRF